MKTADLRRALDPRRSAVVAACAGSGKTWLLTARVLRLLVEGASPGSILAFTYTRAAAAEIRVRVAEGAQRLARADDSDLRALLAELQIESPAAETLAAARKIHRRLLLAQPGLEISTMHGWFLELIKSRPWEEGRVGPPRLRVGGDAALIRRLAWRDFCAAPPPEVGAIFAAGFETESLREWMFSFLSRRVARRIMDDWSRREGGAPSIPESIVDWRQAARAFLRAAPPTGGKEFTIRRAQIEAALAESNPTAAWAAVFTAAGTPRKDLEKPAAEELHALAESLRARAAARLSPAATAAGDYFARLYERRKAARGEIDYDDIEYLAWRAVVFDSLALEIVGKMDRRCRHLVVDEFQDANPAQWAIVRRWLHDCHGSERAPSVFVVGDKKQAIYGFRGGDSRLLDCAADFLRDYYRAAQIAENTSRRCAPLLLRVVDCVFLRAAKKGAADSENGDPAPDSKSGDAPNSENGDSPDSEDSENDDFTPHRAHSQNRALPARIVCYPLLTSDKAPAPPPFRNPLFDALPTVADARGKQAQFAVRLLVDEIVGKWKIVDGGGARVCDFSDALILAPQRAHLTPVLEALDARGIPHRSDRRGGFLAERECADLRDLLAFLCAPHEDLRLARALKSPLFAVSDSELLAAVQAAQAAPGGKISNPTLWEKIKKLTENGGGGEALSRARRLLEDWLAQTFASRLPAHDLLSVVFAQGEVEARYAACLPPPQRARGIENLRRFLGFSLSLHGGRRPLPAQFSEDADALAEEDGESFSVGDGARVSTIHKAKGMEAAIVILLESNLSRARARGKAVAGVAEVEWPPEAPAPTRFLMNKKSFLSERARAAIEAKGERERSRLLYVAMTRARQALLVLGGGEAEKDSWHARILRACLSLPHRIDADGATIVGDDLGAGDL